MLSWESGGGTFQYTQAILSAVLALPRSEYTLVAAVAQPSWMEHIDPAVRVVRLRNTVWNRTLNRAWAFLGLPIALWRRTVARLDSDVRALVSERCDLWLFPGNERFSFRAPLPALGTVHDLMHRYEPGFPEVSERGEYESREFHFGETVRWSRGVIVDSNVGKRQLVESYHADPEKVFVLPYIAPMYFYSGTDAETDAVAHRYGLPKKFFFYPAQFFQHKNHASLVLGVERMRESHPDVRLVLVGAKDRNSHEEVRALVSRLNLAENVLFLGYVPDRDMPALYRLARALVMPTYFGPTNIPQLEAFATGCPVATSRIYGIPEQVGDAALLFDPASIDEIHACLEKLWTDDSLCAELSRKGRDRAARWGPPQFAARLREIIDTVI